MQCSRIDFKKGRLSTQAQLNYIGPLKVEYFLQLVTEKKVRDKSKLNREKANIPVRTAFGGCKARNCRQSLGGGCGPQETVSRKMGTSSLELQGNGFFQQPVSLEGILIPKWQPHMTDTLISAP